MFDPWNDTLTNPDRRHDWINLETGDFICSENDGSLLLGRNDAIQHYWQSWITRARFSKRYGHESIREIAASPTSTVMMKVPGTMAIEMDGKYSGLVQTLLRYQMHAMEIDPAVWISETDIAGEFVPRKDIVDLMKEACQDISYDGDLDAFMKTFGDPIYKSAPESAHACVEKFLQGFKSFKYRREDDCYLAEAIGEEQFLPEYRDYAWNCTLSDLVLSMEISSRHNGYSLDAMEAVCETTLQMEKAGTAGAKLPMNAAIDEVLTRLEIPLESPMRLAWTSRMRNEYMQNVRPSLVRNGLLLTEHPRPDKPWDHDDPNDTYDEEDPLDIDPYDEEDAPDIDANER